MRGKGKGTVLIGWSRNGKYIIMYILIIICIKQHVSVVGAQNENRQTLELFPLTVNGKTQFILQYSFFLIGDGDLNVGNVLYLLSS